MEERLKLVKRTFSIESQPKRGTRIHAHVPPNSESGAIVRPADAATYRKPFLRVDGL
jgi:hypothetical protein